MTASRAAPDRRERFERIYTGHHGQVVAYLVRRGAAQPADLAAEVFTVCWRKLDRVPDPALPWLYVVARNALANDRRARARDHRLTVRLGRPEPVPPPGEPPDGALARALGELSEKDREVLRLVAWEDLGGDDLALALGCSRATAAVRLHRARRRLSARLDRPEPHPTPRVVLQGEHR